MKKLIARRELSICFFVLTLTSLCFTVLCFANECVDPKSISLAAVPSEKGTMKKEYYAPMIEHIEKVTGKEVSFYMPTSNASVLEAMINGYVDVARFGPYMYIISQEKAKNKIELFGIWNLKKGIIQPAGGGYHSVLITKKGGKYDSIEKLKGTVLSLMDPGSTSGSLVPEVFFSKSKLDGVKLRDYFGRVFYSGGQDLSAIAVYQGRADAAFVSGQILDRVLRKRNWADSFNYLWSSPMIPVDGWVYKRNFCPSLKTKIQEAFYTFHQNPKSVTYFNNINGTHFGPAKDSDYDMVRQLAKEKKKTKK